MPFRDPPGEFSTETITLSRNDLGEETKHHGNPWMFWPCSLPPPWIRHWWQGCPACPRSWAPSQPYGCSWALSPHGAHSVKDSKPQETLEVSLTCATEGAPAPIERLWGALRAALPACYKGKMKSQLTIGGWVWTCVWRKLWGPNWSQMFSQE